VSVPTSPLEALAPEAASGPVAPAEAGALAAVEAGALVLLWEPGALPFEVHPEEPAATARTPAIQGDRSEEIRRAALTVGMVRQAAAP